jgi:hypothetical protein
LVPCVFKPVLASVGNEQKARKFLEIARWGAVARCPQCGTAHAPPREKLKPWPEPWPPRVTERMRGQRHQYRCCNGKCPTDVFTVSTHTFMHRTRLPYATWQKAIELVWDGADLSTLQTELGLARNRAAEVAEAIVYAIDEGDLDCSNGSWMIRADSNRYPRKRRPITNLELQLHRVYKDLGKPE